MCFCEYTRNCIAGIIITRSYSCKVIDLDKLVCQVLLCWPLDYPKKFQTCKECVGWKNTLSRTID